MRILVDIVHMADVNFYKEPIRLLRESGHEIVLTAMDRGILPAVVEKELGPVIIAGRHGKGLLKKVRFNLERVNQLRKIIKEKDPDVVTSFSYYPAAATYGTKTMSVIFHDDPEYRMQFRLCRLFAKKLVLPDFLGIAGKKIRTYHSFKEYSYLKGFKPNKAILKEMGLKEKGYVFAREISQVSLNYSKASFNMPKALGLIKDKVLLSLENKQRADEFRCTILQEPVKDFYSLLYYSRCLITSGDTMAREAALLGVPAFYVGDRDMLVNRPLIDTGLLFDDLPQLIYPFQVEPHLFQ